MVRSKQYTESKWPLDGTVWPRRSSTVWPDTVAAASLPVAALPPAAAAAATSSPPAAADAAAAAAGGERGRSRHRSCHAPNEVMRGKW